MPEPILPPSSLPRRRRRWLRVSLRGLMILVMLVGGGLGWVLHQIRTQRAAIVVVEAEGGTVEFDYQIQPNRKTKTLRTEPAAPRWVRRWLGDELFQTVVAVERLTVRSPTTLAAVGRFAGLERLDLTDTSTTGAGYDQLRGLRRLRTVHISGPGLTDAALGAVAGIRSIEDLTIRWAGASDAGFAQLATLPAVADLAVIGRLTYLIQLGVSQSEIKGTGLHHLGSMAQLEDLNLNFTNVSDPNVRALGDRPALTTLDLGNTWVSDAGLPALTRLANLPTLNLSGTGVTDAGMPTLARLPGLVNLSLTNNPAITDAGLIALTPAPRVLNLDVTRTATTTLSGISGLRTPRPALRVFKTFACRVRRTDHPD